MILILQDNYRPCLRHNSRQLLKVAFSLLAAPDHIGRQRDHNQIRPTILNQNCARRDGDPGNMRPESSRRGDGWLVGHDTKSQSIFDRAF